MNDETKKKYGDPYNFTHPLNQQTGIREQTRSIWGFGGFLANAIDVALRHDEPDGFVDLMRDAKLDASAKTFDDLTMEQYCDKYSATKCKKALIKLKAQAEIRAMSAQLREDIR